VKITSKGQVTIPLEFRTQFGFLPHTEIDFVAERSGLRIVKAKGSNKKGSGLIDRMRGKGSSRLTTDEIMKLTRG